MAIGATIQDDRGKELATVSQLLGKGTNNIAEYRAGIEGLKNARDLGATEVELRMDSENSSASDDAMPFLRPRLAEYNLLFHHDLARGVMKTQSGFSCTNIKPYLSCRPANFVHDVSKCSSILLCQSYAILPKLFLVTGSEPGLEIAMHE